MRTALLLLLMLCAMPAQARTQTLVVIADFLTLGDVTQPGLPALAQMREQGQLCLMSPGLAQGADPVANVYASLGAGDSIRVGDKSQGLLSRALAAAHIRTALIGTADGDAAGSYRPAALLMPAPDVTAADDGTRPDTTVPGGRRIDPALLWTTTQTALRTADVVVVHDGDFARVERERGDLLTSAYAASRSRALHLLDAYLGLAIADTSHSRQVLLIVPTPPPDSPRHWQQLTPLLRLDTAPAYASDAPPGSILSATTQTPGLVAARDLAPTLLALLTLTPPVQMTGAPIMYLPGNRGASLAALRQIDRLTLLNQQAQNPFFWTGGCAGTALLFAAMGLYLSGRLRWSESARRAALYGVRVLSAVPLALLLAPLVPVQTLPFYLMSIYGTALLLALLPSPGVLLSVTAGVIVADGLTGTSLVSQSLLSVYALAGIRFYGIGNEYMGVLIAGTLLYAASLNPNWGRGTGIFLLFAMVIFVLSFPAFGAKAGGAVTAMATFAVAWRRLRGLPVTVWHVLLSVAAGFALVFAWAAVGHWLPMRRTHIDTAAEALAGGRFGYIGGVALRKVGLAVRVALNPGTLMGLLALGLLGGAARLALRRQVSAYLEAHSRFNAVWTAGLWGCLIAVLFNDSGIVAAILMLYCLGMTLLHGLFSTEGVRGHLPEWDGT